MLKKIVEDFLNFVDYLEQEKYDAMNRLIVRLIKATPIHACVIYALIRRVGAEKIREYLDNN
jgi:hypothetical protein